MKKRTLRERISYWFDCMMSKGPIAMSLLLFSMIIFAGIVLSQLNFTKKKQA